MLGEEWRAREFLAQTFVAFWCMELARGFHLIWFVLGVFVSGLSCCHGVLERMGTGNWELARVDRAWNLEGEYYDTHGK